MTKAAILLVKQVVWLKLAVEGLKLCVIFSVSDHQNFYLLSLKQSPHVNALRTIRKMWGLCEVPNNVYKQKSQKTYLRIQ